MQTVLIVYAALMTLIAVTFSVLHFANPYPLIQIPDRGHRLYSVANAQERDLAIEVFRRAGLVPYGDFTAGVQQTLMHDGFTVIAWGVGTDKPALSLPVKNPLAAAVDAQLYLAKYHVESRVIRPNESQGDFLVILDVPSLKWNIAYRLTGRKMPAVHWEHKY